MIARSSGLLFIKKLMNIKRYKCNSGDYDEALAHACGKDGPILCWICDQELTETNTASAPAGSDRAELDRYMIKPRCLSCESEMKSRSPHNAMILFDSFIAWLKPERSEDEKKALDEIYAKEDHQALEQADMDRLAQEHGDGRVHI